MSKSKHPPQPSKLNFHSKQPAANLRRVRFFLKKKDAGNKKKKPKIFFFGVFCGDRRERNPPLTDVKPAL